MLAAEFGAGEQTRVVRTGVSNAKLIIRRRKVILWTRPGSGHPEQEITLNGSLTDEWVIRRSWEFLRRHHTPRTPKRRRIPKSVFVKRAKQRAAGLTAFVLMA